MIVLQGKYNIARIHLPNDKNPESEVAEKGTYVFLEKPLEQQITNMLNCPAFQGEPVVIMPDTHWGKGSCVGFTWRINRAIIPNIVGVDIGCGITATKIPHNRPFSLQAFDEFVRENIPAGFSIRSKPELSVIAHESEAARLVTKTTASLVLDEERVMNSVGTLGGGNHFIELGVDEQDDLWLTIHSGSRNFGLQVATSYQSVADRLCEKYFLDYGDLNFIPTDSQEASDYYDAMLAAQMYASINRRTITRIILDGFFERGFTRQIDSVHNYIDFEDGIIRKGATLATTDTELVIPFNMEDGLIIATGRGNENWNFSAPHGAGRILSRGKAKKMLNLDEARDGMSKAGVYTTSLSQETLDEAKGAYKPKDLILEMIKDTVEVNHFVKPIYNFKAK